MITSELVVVYVFVPDTETHAFISFFVEIFVIAVTPLRRGSLYVQYWWICTFRVHVRTGHGIERGATASWRQQYVLLQTTAVVGTGTSIMIYQYCCRRVQQQPLLRNDCIDLDLAYFGWHPRYFVPPLKPSWIYFLFLMFFFFVIWAKRVSSCYMQEKKICPSVWMFD